MQCIRAGQLLFPSIARVTDYTITTRLDNVCPEDSPDHKHNWGSIDRGELEHTVMSNIDFATCDLFRSGSISEFVAENVPDGGFVCYAVAHQRADHNTAPQIVVLYDKLEASTAHDAVRYLNFFCTCAYSTR